MRDPKQVAQEFKALNVAKMSAITNAELESGGWDKKATCWQVCPNVMNYIEHVNKMSEQVRDDILLCNSLAEQKEMYVFYAKLLDEATKIGDFQTANAIYNSIGLNPAITTLSGGLGNDETKAIIEKHDTLFDPSDDQGNLRRATKKSNSKQATIPLFSITLKRLLTADGLPVPDEEGPQRTLMLDNVKRRKEAAIGEFKSGIEHKKLPNIHPKLLERHGDWLTRPKMTTAQADALSGLMKQGRGASAQYWVNPDAIKDAVQAFKDLQQQAASKPKNAALLEFAEKEGTFRSGFLNKSEAEQIAKMIERESNSFSKTSAQKRKKLGDLSDLMESAKNLGECSDKLKVALERANGDPNKLGPEVDFFVKQYVARLADYNNKYIQISPLLGTKDQDKDVGALVQKINRYVMSIRPAQDASAALNISQVFMMPVQRGMRFNLHLAEIVKLEKAALRKQHKDQAATNIIENVENVSRLNTRLGNLEQSVATSLKGAEEPSDQKRPAARQQVFDIIDGYKNAGVKLEFVSPENKKIWKEQASYILNILNSIESQVKAKNLGTEATNHEIDKKITNLLEQIAADPNIHSYIKEDCKILLDDLERSMAFTAPTVIPQSRSMVNQGNQFQDKWKDVMAKREEQKRERAEPREPEQQAKDMKKTLRKGEFEYEKRNPEAPITTQLKHHKAKAAATERRAAHDAAKDTVRTGITAPKKPPRNG